MHSIAQHSAGRVWDKSGLHSSLLATITCTHESESSWVLWCCEEVCSSQSAA